MTVRASQLALVAACLLSGNTVQAGETERVPAELAACPGGTIWFQAEQVRRKALQLGPDTVYDDPALREELLAMAAADQRARNAITPGTASDAALQETLAAVDARHLQRLKQVAGTRGAPTPSQVGRAGMSALWLLVQHADRDPAFQERMLAQFHEYDERDGVSRQQLALLTDRVLLAQGKLQRYGSQFEGGFGTPLVLRPVEAPGLLDQRRQQMHMPPMRTYRCALEGMHSGGAAITQPAPKR